MAGLVSDGVLGSGGGFAGGGDLFTGDVLVGGGALVSRDGLINGGNLAGEMAVSSEVSLWAVAHLSLLTGFTNVVVNSVDLVVAYDRISNCYKNVFELRS